MSSVKNTKRYKKIAVLKENQPLQFHAIFHPEPEGGFTVVVPSLPGCITYGKTLAQAKEMVRDAIEGYLASVEKHKEKVQSDEGDFISTINFYASNLKSLAYA